jgi:redox-sensitive bicupin YhaK (pirin superfamily)
MNDPVLRTMPLGMQWPTVDPFLFCAHHDDAYPSGNADLGPDASLTGRDIGMDFANIDGWNMYHGQRVPGFPPHPHRGFETVTYVRKGLIDHSDSLGAAARFGRGDVQWLTAGRGIQHSEMFPLLDGDGPNPLELFQIWLNLPAADKMVDPYFTMIWGGDLPRIVTGTPGAEAQITVIAGSLDDTVAPEPPPDSWAGRSDADVAIWHVVLHPGGSWVMPVAAQEETVRTIYIFEGDAIRIAGHDEPLQVKTGAVVRCDVPVEISSPHGAEIMVLQGRPLGEPVVQHGPFVMNTDTEIEEAMVDYRRTRFGGWPWPDTDPVHDRDQDRFARHVDGRMEHPD